MPRKDRYIKDRSNHQYAPPGEERSTPVGEIPPEFRQESPLPGTNRTQTTDCRLCYNWQPGLDGGRYVECGSVASDAAAGK